MAQAFISTYKNHYRWTCQPRRLPCNPEKLSVIEPEGEIWSLHPNDVIDEELQSSPEIKETIHKLYLKRMRTTYQVSTQISRNSLHFILEESGLNLDVDPLNETEAILLDDELGHKWLEHCKQLYSPKSRKVIPPLHSTQSGFGYIKPSKLLTPITVHQNSNERLQNLPKIKEAIHKLYLKRMRTTYQVSYCENLKYLEKDSGPNVDPVNETEATRLDDDLGHEWLEHCKKLYSPKNRKIIPPLNSARNVLGYMRPSRLLTPITVYQNSHGRVGYNMLNQIQLKIKNK